VYTLLFKGDSKGTETEISAFEIPDLGAVVRTLTRVRDELSESSVFVPGAKIDGGKLVAIASDPALPSVIQNLCGKVDALERLCIASAQVVQIKPVEPPAAPEPVPAPAPSPVDPAADPATPPTV